MAKSSDLGRRAPVGFSKGAIESPHTAETGGVRNLTERQSSFVDQFLGEVQTTRFDHCGGRGAQMLEKETAQLPAADAESRGESLDAFVFDAAFADQTQGAANCSRRS